MKKIFYGFSIAVILLVLVVSPKEIKAQSWCYDIGNKFVTFYLPCSGMKAYHNQNRMEHDFSIRISDIDHMSIGKRQPGDPQSLFILMNKDETDYYVIILTTDDDSRELLRSITKKM